MLVSKLALDHEEKKHPDEIAEWRYEDVPNKVWEFTPLSSFLGIGKKTEKK
nr:hypothetical protein [Staphylococcus pseudintermedius]